MRQSPQIDGILSIADKISRQANKDDVLVSIESTIPKGTSKYLNCSLTDYLLFIFLIDGML